jgi:CBS domain-containing protein
MQLRDPGEGAGKGEREPEKRGAIALPSDMVGPDQRPPDAPERALGDFTTTPAILRLVPLAIVIGALATGIALALLDMIGFLTNLLYYQRLSVQLVSPENNQLGLLAVAVPVFGGLVVGLMARFGSEQIRGHGIPEAMERILINGSRVQPRLALLKPISSAVSIGSGGPFGAEGPIILTGGAVGSIVGQLFRLTAIERRALLVAGAAAGMSAVFGTPVAATLFGVELLAFEWKPRSMVLIGLAAATADGLRMVLADAGLLAPQPIFPMPAHPPLGLVVGVLPWSRVLEEWQRPGRLVADVMLEAVELAYPDEILRTVADRMAHGGLGVLPVVDHAYPTHLVGLITQFDLLQARQRLLEEERHAERVLTLRRADVPMASSDDEQSQSETA